MTKLRWRVKLVAEREPGVVTETELACIERDEQIGTWFKKCHFQVTPEIDRALMGKGFLVLGVTLI